MTSPPRNRVALSLAFAALGCDRVAEQHEPPAVPDAAVSAPIDVPARVDAPAPVAAPAHAGAPIPVAAEPAAAAAVPAAVPPAPIDALVDRLVAGLELAGVDAAERGWTAYRAKDYPTARAWFAVLTRAEPSVWKHAHNLACASALAGEHEDARIALEESLRRGGTAARAKAMREADFAGLRHEPWFIALGSGVTTAPSVAPTPKLRTKELAPREPAIPFALAPASGGTGLVPITTSFDPFIELLRATPGVSRSKRTAYRKRKLDDDTETDALPAWTTVAGRKELAKPAWWRAAEGHTYLVVPYILAGYYAQFGSSIDIHGYAIFAVEAGVARLVHGFELDLRLHNCGGDDELWALFADRGGTALYEVQGCAGEGGEPDACVVRYADGTLTRSCSGMMAAPTSGDG